MQTEDSALELQQSQGHTSLGELCGGRVHHLEKILCGQLFLASNVGVPTTQAHHKPQPEGGVQTASTLPPNASVGRIGAAASEVEEKSGGRWGPSLDPAGRVLAAVSWRQLLSLPLVHSQ